MTKNTKNTFSYENDLTKDINVNLEQFNCENLSKEDLNSLDYESVIKRNYCMGSL